MNLFILIILIIMIYMRDTLIYLLKAGCPSVNQLPNNNRDNRSN